MASARLASGQGLGAKALDYVRATAFTLRASSAGAATCSTSDHAYAHLLARCRRGARSSPATTCARQVGRGDLPPPRALLATRCWTCRSCSGAAPRACATRSDRPRSSHLWLPRERIQFSQAWTPRSGRAHGHVREACGRLGLAGRAVILRRQHVLKNLEGVLKATARRAPCVPTWSSSNRKRLTREQRELGGGVGRGRIDPDRRAERRELLTVYWASACCCSPLVGGLRWPPAKRGRAYMGRLLDRARSRSRARGGALFTRMSGINRDWRGPRARRRRTRRLGESGLRRAGVHLGARRGPNVPRLRGRAAEILARR